ncbi:MAG: hypothetical protein WBC91_02540 [Phototrophicaceae bacterium]
MQPIQIYPEYALILTYDIKPGAYERYFRWVMNDFLPAMHKRKVYRQYVWLVVSGAGSHPERQLDFITEDLDTLKRLLASTEWTDLEKRLQQFADNYSSKVVKYTGQIKI